VDAFNPPADGVIIRAMMESMFLMYGAVGLWLMALFIAILSYVTLAGGALPRWSAWLGYVCSLACLAFVPTMFVRYVDVMGFYNPAGWGPRGHRQWLSARRMDDCCRHLDASHYRQALSPRAPVGAGTQRTLNTVT